MTAIGLRRSNKSHDVLNIFITSSLAPESPSNPFTVPEKCLSKFAHDRCRIPPDLEDASTLEGFQQDTVSGPCAECSHGPFVFIFSRSG